MHSFLSLFRRCSIYLPLLLLEGKSTGSRQVENTSLVLLPAERWELWLLIVARLFFLFFYFFFLFSFWFFFLFIFFFKWNPIEPASILEKFCKSWKFIFFVPSLLKNRKFLFLCYEIHQYFWCLYISSSLKISS